MTVRQSSSAVFRAIVSLAAAAVICLSPLPAAAASLAGGDLIKLPDDRNPDTTADSAVYYYGADGKRYVFPNSQAYFTWYADFSSVKTVSAAELAAIPLGGNVVYRPGTRLVKITSDPNVYAVEPGGVLRWIQSEAVAKALYGDQWNQRVDDIPDAFFFNYTIGAPLAAAVYPDGSVVRRSSDSAYFRIENRSKRRIPSAALGAALRLQDKFTLTSSGDLSDYPDGAAIANAETSITDTAQKSLVQATSVPTFTVRLPSTNYIGVGSDVVLLELHVSAVTAFRVRQLTIRLDATTGAPAAGVTDDDKGGLVYLNNAQANFRLLRLVDAAGVEPFGRKDAVIDINQDQSQTFVFTGDLSVPAGTDKVLYFRAQNNNLLPTGEGYKATLLVSGTQVVDQDGGASVAFAPTADLAGAALTTLSSVLEVKSSAYPGNKTFVRGAKNAEIAGLNFKATTVAPNVIKAVTFQGYVDEESNGNFLPGSDSDNGTPTAVRDLVPAVSLYDDKGNKIAGPASVDLEGRAAFSGLAVAIPAGQSAVLVIRGDLSPTIDLENLPNRLTFDITDASTDMQVVDDKGVAVPAAGLLPNSGNKAAFYATVKKRGTVKFSWSGTGGRAMAGTEVQIGTLSIEAKDDSYSLKTVTFRQVGGIAQSVSGVRLVYPSGGTAVSASQSFLGNSVTFTGLPVVLEKDKTTDLKLYTTVAQRSGGAVYAEQIKVQFGSADALEFDSQTDGTVFSASDLGPSGSDFTVGTNAASAAVVRYSLLTAVKTADFQPNAVYHDSAAETLRFHFRADATGAVRVKKLVFKVTPGDAGQPGPDNDALEIWTKVNGDFNNDYGVVDLVQVTGAAKTVIGEDSSARVTYSTVHAGTKNSTPVASGFVSQPGDYGLIEYVFNDGSELSIGSGGDLEFRFSLDTSAFDSKNDYSLNVEMLGGTDLSWTDIPTGAYTPLAGMDAAGFPLSNAVTVKK